MMTSRRTFLKQSSLAMAGIGIGVPRWSERWGQPLVAGPADVAHVADAALVRNLALRAIDAAKAAGATYADVRLTRTLTDNYTGTIARGEWETLAVGVRALVNGYWGFAASSYWEPDEVVRLAQDAVSQAKTYALGTRRVIEWSPIPVASGSWSTPVQFDPFAIPIEEKCDFAGSWVRLAQQFDRRLSAGIDMTFTREERAIATTDGAFFTQTLYASAGKFDVVLHPNRGDLSRVAQVHGRGLTKTAVGWELFLDAKLPDQLPQLVDEAEQQLRGRPSKPGDIGRYDIVFDAETMAALTDRTIGVATQLDRALGYEANASGTSYLGPHPDQFLGTPVASSAVTITANRSLPRGLATVKWDDEGVVPVPFTLVNEGTLVDYQTTREQAAWLAPWYRTQGRAIQSHGCAAADSALSVTMQHMPNLVLEPGRQNVGFSDLVAGTKRGLALVGGSPETNLTGSEGGLFHFHSCREIVNGKLGAEITDLVPIFNSTDFWKHVVAVGGAKSAEQFPSMERKGEPAQITSHSIRAVPATVTNVACISPARRS
jgi:TldD protein